MTPDPSLNRKYHSKPVSHNINLQAKHEYAGPFGFEKKSARWIQAMARPHVQQSACKVEAKKAFWLLRERDKAAAGDSSYYGCPIGSLLCVYSYGRCYRSSLSTHVVSRS